MTSLQLGVVGNCQISSLIDPRGRHVWTCWPRPDADPIFCSLLAGGGAAEAAGGFYDVVLDRFVRAEQAYVPNTAILRTTLYDERGGVVRLDDFAPRFVQFGRNFRPLMLVRTVVALAGRPLIRIRLRPKTNYGAGSPKVTHGSNHIRFESPDLCLRLTTNASFSAVLEEHCFTLDEPIALILAPDESIKEAPTRLAEDFYAQTHGYWTQWTRGLSIPFEWQQEVIRAAITLKLCTYEDSGAVLAALTTSNTDPPHTKRNWDYRY